MKTLLLILTYATVLSAALTLVEIVTPTHKFLDLIGVGVTAILALLALYISEEV